jgi:hypothetical protein
MTSYQPTVSEKVVSGFSRIVAGRIRLYFCRPEPDNIFRVTDEATLKAIGRLEEHRLRDIGVCRKPRRAKWRSIGRGMAPIGIVEFDYFRLDT